MKFAIPLLLFLVPYGATYGQEAKVKFGKIDPSDLAMTVFSPDTEAQALILSDIALIRFDPVASRAVMIRYHHVVIKILTARGAEEYGDITIPYPSHKQASYITNLRAMIHLPDGTEIKLRNENFFEEEVNMYWSQKKIAFPNVQAGAVLEYEYQLNSHDILHPVDWFFQGDAPIRYAELQVRIPNWLDYVILTQGQRLLENKKVQEAENGVEVVYNKWTFINRNVPALKEEAHITTMDDYYSRIRFRLNSVHFPQQLRQNYLNDWASVSDAIWSEPSFGYQLNNKRPGELVLEKAGIMPSDTGNQFSRAARVYAYINSNIESTGFNAIGLSDEISDILKRRTGDSGQLNKLMLAALLQLDIDAVPVLISTRNHGRVFEQYPFIDQFDHMLIRAILDGKTTWIDLGDPNRPMGLLAPTSLNARGWVAAKKDPFWTDLPMHESKTVVYVRGQLTPEGRISGEVEARFTGFHALEQRENFAEQKENYFNDQLLLGTLPVTLDDLEAIQANETEKPFQIKGMIRDLPATETSGDRMYLNPLVLKSLLENPFRQEHRDYPVEYNYPEDYTVIFELKMPEGYLAESLPKPAKYTNEPGTMMTSILTSSSNDIINAIFKFQIRQLVHPPEEYEVLKNFYNLRKEMLSEPFVLRKPS